MLRTDASRAAPAQLPGRTGAWQEEPGFGVYVHIPFCLHRCHYCDFNTYEGLEGLMEPYVDALCASIEALPGRYPEATSVFFGGGTPTLLAPSSLDRILTAVRQRVGLAHGAEVTVEANPETVDEEVFGSLLESGFNRVSIGVQSLRPSVLEGLGRTHGPERALGAIGAARAAGVPDVSADLIYGSPWESQDDWLASLEGVVAAGTDHVSAYALTVEEGTPLATLVRTDRLPDVDPDVQAERFDTACEILGAAGFERYEISNWSRPGRASAHNVLYWSAGDYLGLGAGAHGHSSGRRYWLKRLPRDFIEDVASGGSAEEGSESLDMEARAAEAAMLGLRLSSGVDTGAFARRFGDHLDRRAGEIEQMVAEGLLESRDGWLCVTPKGAFRTDAVIARLF